MTNQPRTYEELVALREALDAEWEARASTPEEAAERAVWTGARPDMDPAEYRARAADLEYEIGLLALPAMNAERRRRGQPPLRMS